MRVTHKDIVLRDYQESDIDSDIRWMTVEIAWHDWDAPWEAEESLREFDTDEFREKKLKRLKSKVESGEFRWTFEVDTKEGIHIGRVNSYLIDQDYNWVRDREGKGYHTLGIDICESSYWGKSYGTQAFSAFINYHLIQGVTDIYTQTWSGNTAMVALAEKLGFEVCKREPDYRKIRGKYYDGLTFKLNVAKFRAFWAEDARNERIFQVLVIPYCRVEDKVQYAIFQRADDLSWQWIAGGGNVGESPVEAAKRESWEEARISLESPLIPLMAKAQIPATCFPDLADPDVISLTEFSFAVEVDPGSIELSSEHTQLRLVNFAEAMDVLKWDSNKNALKELQENLKTSGIS